MVDSRKTREEIIEELRMLRIRVAQLEATAGDIPPSQPPLPENDQRFRLLAENVPGVIYLHRADECHSMLFLNDECEVVTGYPKEDFLDGRRHFGELHHPEDAESIRGAINRAIENHCPFHLVYRIRHRSGHDCWIEEFGTGVFDENDERVLYIEGFLHDITERKRIEEELHRERRLFMGGPVVVFRWVARDGWPVEYVSPNVSHVFGYSADDFTGGRVKYADVVHPSDIERITDEVLALQFEQVDCFEQDYRVVRSDGQVRWLYDFTVVVRDENEKITHYEGYVLDVTERKWAEQEQLTRLERIQRQQTAIVDLATHDKIVAGEIIEAARTATEISANTLDVERAGVWLLDEDRNHLRCIDLYQKTGGCHSDGIVLCMEEYPRYFETLSSGRAIDASDARTDARTSEFRDVYLEPNGITSMLDVPIRSEGQVIGILCHEHVGPVRLWQTDEILFAGEVGDQIAQAIANHDRRRAEQALQEANETLEDRIRERTQELADTNERLHREIEERRQAEEALRASEERFRKISSAAQDAIVMADADGKISYWNEAAQTIFGYTEAEALGRSVHEFLAPKRYLEASQRALPAFRETGQGDAIGQTLELAAVRKNGEEFPIELSLSSVHMKGEWHAIAIIRDITQRKHAEEALRTSERLASVGTLAAGIANEINNPLGAILLDTKLAMQFADQPEVAQKSLGSILEHAKRCTRVVKSLLQFAKDHTSAKWACDLNKIVRTAHDEAQSTAEERGVTIAMDLEPGLPLLMLNPLAIGQVLSNLIRNAIQACDKKGHVTLQTRIDQDEVVVAVVDDGRGMSPDEREHAFDPFFTTQAEAGGTGLGLSLAHGIIIEHEGSIEIASEDGEGTTVTVHFPLKACHAEGQQEREPTIHEADNE